MYTMSDHETQLICKTSQSLQRQRKWFLSEKQKEDLKTVLKDEKKHSLEAHRYIDYVRNRTKIEPIQKDFPSEFFKAYIAIVDKLSSSGQDLFSVLCVCIAENIVTKELAGVNRHKNVHPMFYQINYAHILDEAKHSIIFTDLIKTIWSQAASKDQRAVLKAIPSFISLWLASGKNLSYEQEILKKLGFETKERKQILFETFPKKNLETEIKLNPLFRRVENWLRRVGVWQTKENIWQTRFISYPKTILENLEDISHTHPDHSAVMDSYHTFSYLDLRSRVNQIAIALIHSDLIPGSRVAIHLKQGFEFVSTLLGIMKAKMVAVPIEQQIEGSYLKSILKELKVDILIKDSGDYSGCSNSVWPIKKIPYNKSSQKIESINGSEIACILFTSGSTSQAKQIYLRHDALAEFAHAAKDAFKINSADRILQFSNLGFDASIAEIIHTIVSGATLIIPDHHAYDSIPRFLEECDSKQVSILNLPAAFWSQLALQTERLPTCIQSILCYGESLNLSAIQKWYKFHPKPKLFNTYGPTESTIGTSYCLLDDEKNLRLKTQLIGKAFQGRKITIRDQESRALPVGQIGEICISGLCVEGRKLEKEKYYRSGDFGKWEISPDTGNKILIFIGRQDRFTKICGKQIDLAFLEKILSQHHLISEARVLKKEINTLSSLAVFITKISDSASINEDGIREYLKRKIGSHLTPKQIFILEKWPLTTRSKVDTNALLNLTIGNEIDLSLENPKLAQIWKDVLGISKVNCNSDFFELGGHSLLAMLLIGRVNKELSLDYTMKTLIEKPKYGQMLNSLKITDISSKTILPENDSLKIPLLELMHKASLVLYAKKMMGGRFGPDLT